MASPRHTIVETPEYLAGAKGLFTDEERQELVEFLAQQPDAGDIMPGTGGARKLRWRAKGKGKRGGARVITFYSGSRLPVFVLTAFGKGQRSDLSKSEQNVLRMLLAELVDEYEKGRD